MKSEGTAARYVRQFFYVCEGGPPAFLAADNLNVQVLPGLKILKKEERFGKQERFMVV